MVFCYIMREGGLCVIALLSISAILIPACSVYCLRVSVLTMEKMSNLTELCLHFSVLVIVGVSLLILAWFVTNAACRKCWK